MWILHGIRQSDFGSHPIQIPVWLDSMHFMLILRWMNDIRMTTNRENRTYEKVQFVPWCLQPNIFKNVASIFYFFQWHLDIQNQWFQITYQNWRKLSVSMPRENPDIHRSFQWYKPGARMWNRMWSWNVRMSWRVWRKYWLQQFVLSSKCCLQWCLPLSRW